MLLTEGLSQTDVVNCLLIVIPHPPYWDCTVIMDSTDAVWSLKTLIENVHILGKVMAVNVT